MRTYRQFALKNLGFVVTDPLCRRLQGEGDEEFFKNPLAWLPANDARAARLQAGTRVTKPRKQ